MWDSAILFSNLGEVLMHKVDTIIYLAYKVIGNLLGILTIAQAVALLLRKLHGIVTAEQFPLETQKLVAVKLVNVHGGSLLVGFLAVRQVLLSLPIYYYWSWWLVVKMFVFTRST